MTDPKEIVVIELAHDRRIKLYSDITAQMERLGLNYASWDSLDCGLHLPAGWPIDKDAQPTLTELVVVAAKLKMKIVITDVNVVPLGYERPDEN